MIADPAVPRRDALLRPETMAGVISQRLLGGVPVDRCERTYVKYRFGDSLRAVYRFDGRHVALRTGKRDGIPAPEVGAALYPFPHDRKLTALRDAPQVIERLLGGAATPQLVAYAAEQSATFACRDARGNLHAYAKVQLGCAEHRACRALAGQDAVRVPRVLAASDGVVLLEPLHGTRLDDTPGEHLHALGQALAALHAARVTTASFARLDLERLATAAGVIARARPDAQPAAERLLALLIERADDARREPVLLHGDANLRNALRLEDGTCALLDIEHLAIGPAGADLGQVLANLIVARAPQSAAALLRGYGRPPDKATLRWHTAASLLARVALPAISRHRPDALARLRELLDAGAALLTPVKELAA
jgi:aminoglycoside phosphotransferase